MGFAALHHAARFTKKYASAYMNMCNLLRAIPQYCKFIIAVIFSDKARKEHHQSTKHATYANAAKRS